MKRASAIVMDWVGYPLFGVLLTLVGIVFVIGAAIVLPCVALWRKVTR